MGQNLEDFIQKAINRIVNLELVSPLVVRGGQPDDEALKMICEAGIKTVVNLRHHSKSSVASDPRISFFRRFADDDEIESEQKIVEHLGMKFINISLDGTSPPSDESIKAFINLFDDNSALPVYVHCLHGRERTGFMLAVYRVQIDGWTVEAAYQEMLDHGFDPLRTVLSDRLFEYFRS